MPVKAIAHWLGVTLISEFRSYIMFSSLTSKASLSMCSYFNLTYFFVALIPIVQNTPLEKLDKKHFAKGSRVSQQNGAAAAVQQDDNSKEIALMEAKMIKLCDLLDEVSLCSILI